MIISLVYAQSRNGVIGHEGGLPWRMPSDLKRFKQLTLGKPVVMGRKTWDSLPKKPLPGRPNIVLTRQADFHAEGAIVVHTPEAAIAQAKDAEELCVIGGAQVYRQFLPLAQRVYLTEVDVFAEGDAQAPHLEPAAWRETSREVHGRQAGDDAGFTLRVLHRI